MRHYHILIYFTEYYTEAFPLGSIVDVPGPCWNCYSMQHTVILTGAIHLARDWAADGSHDLTQMLQITVWHFSLGYYTRNETECMACVDIVWVKEGETDRHKEHLVVPHLIQILI